MGKKPSEKRSCVCFGVTEHFLTMGDKQSKATKLDKATVKKTKFTPAELKQLKKEFIALDTDGSGELDPTEFKELFKTRMKGTPPEQMDIMFKAFDTDGSGTISFKELATALSLLSKGDVRSKLEFLFTSYDTDGSGELDPNEIEMMIAQMKGIGAALGRDPSMLDAFVSGLLKKVDKDGNGQITMEEWINAGLSTPSVTTLLLGE